MKSPTKKSRTRRKSATWSKKKRRAISNNSKKDKDEHEQEKVQEQTISPTKSPTKGRKRKHIIMDDDDDIPLTKKNDETSQDKDTIPILMDDDSNCNDLPIALRRSRRVRKAPTTELPSVTSSPTKSTSQVSLKEIKDNTYKIKFNVFFFL